MPTGEKSEYAGRKKIFYKPDELLKAVENKAKDSKDKKERVDYLTFVLDGEPTLNLNLGKEIELLKPLGIKIAVISNTSLVWQKDVQDDLCKVDWVFFEDLRGKGRYCRA